MKKNGENIKMSGNEESGVSRRKMIGNSVKTLAGLYIAPTTLTLLTARQATAQSCQAMMVTVFNQSVRDYVVGYQAASGPATMPVNAQTTVSFSVCCPCTLVFTDQTGLNSFTDTAVCGGPDSWQIT